MKKTILFLIVSASLFLMPASAQALSCTVKASCSTGEADAFHMSDISNGHAELPSQSIYANKVCCTASGLDNKCSGVYDVVLRLDSATNSQVQKNTFSSYPNQACLSIDSGSVECNYVSGAACATLGTDYECIATISDDTGAHVADCDGTNDYSTRVCCRIMPPPPPEPGSHTLVKFLDNKVFIALGETYQSRVRLMNPGATQDNIVLNLSGTYPQAFLKFLQSSSSVCLDPPDCRRIKVTMNPHDQKTVFLEISSSDLDSYTLNISAFSESDPLLEDNDTMAVTVGFSASFPAIEPFSIMLILALSTAAYWKISKK